jgi:hypothetical protein
MARVFLWLKNPPHPNPLLGKERGQMQKHHVGYSKFSKWKNQRSSPSPY